jgi:hypothetical protein
MIWNFIKDKISKLKPEEIKKAAPAGKPEAPKEPVFPAAPEKPAIPPPAAVKTEKAAKDKTDDELAEELNKISPEILAQAKTPQMRQMVLGIYRKMLIEGVDINDGKEVKKWLKKHPEVLQGGEVQKVETVRREVPKVGRNDPCPCGSGKKYKKCCGSKV